LIVMAGLGPAIHVFVLRETPWMPGTGAGHDDPINAGD
jgi:hypothetical protein